LLLARRPDAAGLEKVQKIRSVRPIFAKRRSAAWRSALYKRHIMTLA
jgi:hypothetical protein